MTFHYLKDRAIPLEGDEVSFGDNEEALWNAAIGRLNLVIEVFEFPFYIAREDQIVAFKDLNHFLSVVEFNNGESASDTDRLWFEDFAWPVVNREEAMSVMRQWFERDEDQ